MFLLFFIAVGLAINCKTINRNDLLNCFTNHIDLNHDGNITRGEIAVFTEPNVFFSSCDMNMDNLLNLYDWDHPIGCCKFNPCIYKVCETCVNRFNWTGV